MRGLKVLMAVILASGGLVVGAASRDRSSSWNDRRGHSAEQSYVGNDYPRVWDIHVDRVLKSTEDSVHYDLETAIGRSEWNSTLPVGHGVVFLGPNRRPFTIAMFHQLRCLEIIGTEIVARRDADRTDGPTTVAKHCMTYLRQMVLCRADIRLESVRSPFGPRATTSAVTHVCNDWTSVYAAAEQNYAAHKAGQL